jgi:hypothetical protein
VSVVVSTDGADNLAGLPDSIEGSSDGAHRLAVIIVWLGAWLTGSVNTGAKANKVVDIVEHRGGGDATILGAATIAVNTLNSNERVGSLWHTATIVVANWSVKEVRILHLDFVTSCCGR